MGDALAWNFNTKKLMVANQCSQTEKYVKNVMHRPEEF